jgi:Flp pilus assembly protein TadD
LTLTNALLRGQRFEEARDVLEPLVQAGETPSLLNDLAAAYDGLGKSEEADGLRNRAAARLN